MSVDSLHPDVIAIQRLVERMRLPSPVGQQTVDTQLVALDIHTINIVPTQTQNQCNLISERATLIGVWRNFKKKTGLYHIIIQFSALVVTCITGHFLDSQQFIVYLNLIEIICLRSF